DGGRAIAVFVVFVAPDLAEWVGHRFDFAVGPVFVGDGLRFRFRRRAGDGFRITVGVARDRRFLGVGGRRRQELMGFVEGPSRFVPFGIGFLGPVPGGVVFVGG